MAWCQKCWKTPCICAITFTPFTEVCQNEGGSLYVINVGGSRSHWMVRVKKGETVTVQKVDRKSVV